MQERYTTKNYDASKRIDSAKIGELKEILRLSPSSINSQPWKFTFVSDPRKKEILAKASFFNEPRVLDCDTVVVFSRMDNVELFERQIQETLPEGSVGYYQRFLKPQSEDEIKSWFASQTYLALGVFLSACAAMGIDATPMEGIEPDKYDTLLGIEDYRTLFAVTIGYRDKEDFNQPTKKPKLRKSMDEVIMTL